MLATSFVILTKFYHIITLGDVLIPGWPHQKYYSYICRRIGHVNAGKGCLRQCYSNKKTWCDVGIPGDMGNIQKCNSDADCRKFAGDRMSAADTCVQNWAGRFFCEDGTRIAPGPAGDSIEE